MDSFNYNNGNTNHYGSSASDCTHAFTSSAPSFDDIKIHYGATITARSNHWYIGNYANEIDLWRIQTLGSTVTPTALDPSSSGDPSYDGVQFAVLSSALPNNTSGSPPTPSSVNQIFYAQRIQDYEPPSS